MKYLFIIFLEIVNKDIIAKSFGDIYKSNTITNPAELRNKVATGKIKEEIESSIRLIRAVSGLSRVKRSSVSSNSSFKVGSSFSFDSKENDSCEPNLKEDNRVAQLLGPDNSVPIVYAPKCMVLLSFWPFFRGFQQILSRLLVLNPLEIWLSNVFETPLPLTSKISVHLSLAKCVDSIKFSDPIIFESPSLDDLPLVDFEISPILMLSKVTVATLVACILSERHVVCVSTNLRKLTPVLEAVKTLIFPFVWQHTYIPVLPSLISGILQSPAPLLVGMHTSNIEPGMFEVCLFDLDKDTFIIQNPIYSIEHLIPDYSRNCANTDPREIQACFLKAIVDLLSGYRKFFRDDEFQLNDFLNNVSSDRRLFLKDVLASQHANLFFESYKRKSDVVKFFNDCSDYEASLNHVPTGLLSWITKTSVKPPSLVEHLSLQRCTRDYYNVPEPPKEILNLCFTEDFFDGTLNPELFYPPRTMSVQNMNFAASNEARIHATFCSALISNGLALEYTPNEPTLILSLILKTWLKLAKESNFKDTKYAQLQLENIEMSIFNKPIVIDGDSRDIEILDVSVFEQCPKCGFVLHLEEIMAGFVGNFTTKCYCGWHITPVF